MNGCPEGVGYVSLLLKFSLNNDLNKRELKSLVLSNAASLLLSNLSSS